jgi:signal peptidase I
MDFEGIFVLLFAVSGVILLADRALLKGRRQHGANSAAVPDPLPIQYARSFFPVILIVLLVRAFVFEPFRIPSASMMPGLVDGDFIFVDKFSYGLRLPVINTKILSTGEPRRGDVIVFRLPTDPSIHFIKRLIGLPGDHVSVRDNQITINGVPVPGCKARARNLLSSDLARNSISSCWRRIAPPRISRRWCPRGTISSWATIVMTAPTAGSHWWGWFLSRISWGTRFASG